MGLFDRFISAGSAPEPTERERVRQLQQEVMDWVMGNSDSPSLADYFNRTNSPEVIARAQDLGIEWNQVIAADMGYDASRGDRAVLRVGREGDNSGKEFAIRASDIEALPTEVQAQLSMAGARFHQETRFQPYETCRIAPGATHTDIIYDGMGQHAEPLVLSGRSLGTIRVENVDGIEIIVDNHAHIATLDVNSLTATLTIRDNANIGFLDANNAHLTVINTGGNSTVNRAEFIGTADSPASIAQESHLRGKWHNVTVEHAHLHGVDAAGAQLYNWNISDSDVRSFDLSGATVTNLTIDGELIRSPERLRELGIAVDSSTRIAATPEAIAAARDAQVAAATQAAVSMGTQLNGAVTTAMNLGQSPSTVPLALQNPGVPETTVEKGLDIWAHDMEVARENPQPTFVAFAITGGQDADNIVNFNTALPQTDVVKAVKEQRNEEFAAAAAALSRITQA